MNNILTWQSWYDRRVKKFLAYDTSSREINKVRKSASHSSFFLVFLPLLNVVLGLKETPYLFVEGGGSGRNLFVGRATMKLGFVMNVISLYISETCLRIWEFVAGGHVLQLNYWHWNNSHLFQRRVRFRLTVTSLVARLTACSSTKISSDTGELYYVVRSCLAVDQLLSGRTICSISGARPIGERAAGLRQLRARSW